MGPHQPRLGLHGIPEVKKQKGCRICGILFSAFKEMMLLFLTGVCYNTGSTVRGGIMNDDWAKRMVAASGCSRKLDV